MRANAGGKALTSILALAGLVSPAVAGKVDFNREVLPILTSNCFACHGPDAAKRQADLRLDVRPNAGESGLATIVAGKPEESELIARVTAKDDEGRMPPPKAGKALKREQVRILRKWIEQGGDYPEHWAFVPPRRPPVPKVQNADWVKTPIDNFVLQRLENQKLRPAEKASRRVLIRRVTLDLTGLPPTPEEVKAFVEDDTPTAYERLVDRLLESPQYGERWGRHWLDVARYADSGGFETDIFYGSAWRYRDYVIKSFNADKPFDRFIKEQIAADELYPKDKQALLATALYTIGPALEEAGMVKGKLDYDWLTDAADTTGSAFLGLTVGCARCHDHKYDPVSQKDYYHLQAVFAASDVVDFNADGSVLREHVLLRKTEKDFEQAQKKSVSAKELAEADPYPEIPVRGLGHRTKPIEVHLLRRGELDSPGDGMTPSLPARLAADAKGELAPESARTALANWIASEKNPLTARVIVNRVWQWHFGKGLVRTPNDFGVRGDPPTHPELLDYLAVDFMEHGWSLKHLHRRILLSNTYQMSSTVDAGTLQLDPENRLLTRFQPRRVEAEVVWDSMRAVAGTLNRKQYGLPVSPPLDERELIGNYRKWHESAPEEANRRAVYLVVRRSFRFPALSAFDPPENVSSCGQRDCTVVPNQALTLLNNHATRDQASAFADRMLRETDGSPDAVTMRAWEYVYSRPPADDERRRVTAFLEVHEKASDRKAAVAELCAALFGTNEFLYLP
jgi:mono/diheme cytochrome c family protein